MMTHKDNLPSLPSEKTSRRQVPSLVPPRRSGDGPNNQSRYGRGESLLLRAQVDAGAPAHRLPVSAAAPGLCKLHGASKGNLFQARIQASQDSLAASLGISREWTNQLLARLKAEGWIEAYAPRLPAGRFLPCLFWPGRRLKRLLCILVGYRRPRHSRVKSAPQDLPLSQAEREKSLSFLEGVTKVLILC